MGPEGGHAGGEGVVGVVVEGCERQQRAGAPGSGRSRYPSTPSHSMAARSFIHGVVGVLAVGLQERYRSLDLGRQPVKLQYLFG